MLVKNLVISDDVDEKILFIYEVSGDEKSKCFSSMDKSDIFEMWKKEYGEEELHTYIQEMKDNEEIKVNYAISDDYDSINNIETQIDIRGIINKEVSGSIFSTIADKISRLTESCKDVELDFLVMIHVKILNNNQYDVYKHFVYMIIYKVQIKNIGFFRYIMKKKDLEARLIEYKFIMNSEDN